MRIIDTIVQRSLTKTALDRAESEHKRVAESAQTVADNLTSAGYHSRRAAELRAENADKNAASAQAHEDAALRHGRAARSQQPSDKQSARESSLKAHVLEAEDQALVGKLAKSLNGVSDTPQQAVDWAITSRCLSVAKAAHRADSIDILRECEGLLRKVTVRKSLSKVEVRPTYQPPSPGETLASNCGRGAISPPAKIGGFYNAAAANAIDPTLLEAVRQAGRFNPLAPANNNRSRTPFPAGNRTEDIGARG
jgi:hypothetical protein